MSNTTTDFAALSYTVTSATAVSLTDIGFTEEQVKAADVVWVTILDANELLALSMPGASATASLGRRIPSPGATFEGRTNIDHLSLIGFGANVSICVILETY